MGMKILFFRYSRWHKKIPSLLTTQAKRYIIYINTSKPEAERFSSLVVIGIVEESGRNNADYCQSPTFFGRGTTIFLHISELLPNYIRDLFVALFEHFLSSCSTTYLTSRNPSKALIIQMLVWRTTPSLCPVADPHDGNVPQRTTVFNRDEQPTKTICIVNAFKIANIFLATLLGKALTVERLTITFNAVYSCL